MTLRPRDQIALAVVLILALAGAYYLLALGPERQKASTLATAILKERQALTTAQSSYAAGHAARASIKADAPEWAALREAVPDTSNIPALLRVLERNANAVHVKLQAITISAAASPASAASPSTTTPSTGSASSNATGSGATAPATGGATAPATGGATAPATGGATTVPLSLTLAGGYPALHKLVRRLEGLVVVSGGRVHATGPLLSISNVSLTGAPNLTAQLTATIYQLAAASPAATATPGGQS